METRNDLLRGLTGALTENPLGEPSLNIVNTTLEEAALINGKIFILQTEGEPVTAGQSVDLAIKGLASASPLTLLRLRVVGTVDRAAFKLYEGGDITGGKPITSVRPNRVTTPAANHSVFEGIPSDPLVFTDIGAEITPAGGWQLIGETGPGGSDKVDQIIDIGGFIGKPDEWYVIRLDHDGNQNGELQITLTFIDPE